MKVKHHSGTSALGSTASTPVELFLRVVRKDSAFQSIRATSDDQAAFETGDVPQDKIARISDITPLEAHDLVTRGLPMALALGMTRLYGIVEREALFKVLSLSEHALHYGKGREKLLDINSSDRLLRLAVITEQAFDVFGSQGAAEHWFVTPAIGLAWRRPIDLLQSSAGTELVKTALTRMDYCVFA